MFYGNSKWTGRSCLMKKPEVKNLMKLSLFRSICKCFQKCYLSKKEKSYQLIHIFICFYYFSFGPMQDTNTVYFCYFIELLVRAMKLVFDEITRGEPNGIFKKRDLVYNLNNIYRYMIHST